MSGTTTNSEKPREPIGARVMLPKDDAPSKLSGSLPNRNDLSQSLTSAKSKSPDPEEMAERRRRHEQNDLWRAAGVPKRHATKLNSETGYPAWLEARRGLREKLGSGFLVTLLGGRGNGKTQIGADLIYTSCEAMHSAMFTDAMNLLTEIRDTYRNDDGRSERDVIASYCSPRLLVLDEVGVRGESDWEDRMLTWLIDRRYREVRDTLLISNQTQEDFEASVNPSILDRVREVGGIVVCDWPSYRGAKKCH